MRDAVVASIFMQFLLRYYGGGRVVPHCSPCSYFSFSAALIFLSILPLLSATGKSEKGAVCAKVTQKLDPVGSTVRYEMMKLCTGSV